MNFPIFCFILVLPLNVSLFDVDWPQWTKKNTLYFSEELVFHFLKVSPSSVSSPRWSFTYHVSVSTNSRLGIRVDVDVSLAHAIAKADCISTTWINDRIDSCNVPQPHVTTHDVPIKYYVHIVERERKRNINVGTIRKNPNDVFLLLGQGWISEIRICIDEFENYRLEF